MSYISMFKFFNNFYLETMLGIEEIIKNDTEFTYTLYLALLTLNSYHICRTVIKDTKK